MLKVKYCHSIAITFQIQGIPLGFVTQTGSILWIRHCFRHAGACPSLSQHTHACMQVSMQSFMHACLHSTAVPCIATWMSLDTCNDGKEEHIIMVRDDMSDVYTINHAALIAVHNYARYKISQRRHKFWTFYPLRMDNCTLPVLYIRISPNGRLSPAPT